MRILGNIVAVLYFIFPMSLMIMILLLQPIMLPSEISTITNSGFSGGTKPREGIMFFAFIIGLSTVIPPLRKMYRTLPWLYPFIKIFFINFIIANIGISILQYGYEVNNEARHIIFFILMITQLVICRIAMCVYFKYRPVKAYVER